MQIKRYTKNIAPAKQIPTIGVEYATKNVLLQDGAGIVKAQIWDTSGSEKYKAITTAHYRKAVGALLFYDLTVKETYDDTVQWLKEIEEHTQEGIQIMMIGNKLDLVEEDAALRKVPKEDVLQFCQKKTILYHETSAKSGFNVTESFEELIQKIYEESLKKAPEEQTANNEDQQNDKNKFTLTLSNINQSNNKDQAQKSNCCD